MIGCTKNQNTDHSRLRIHFPAISLVLDPQKMEDAYSMAVVSQIHRGLFRYATTGEVLNDLAESWTEAPDHLSYRIRLKSMTFSDGTPITPVHVQMTFARMFNLGASMAGDIDYMSGSAEFKKTHDLDKFGVKPIDGSVVEFRLSKPSAIFLKQLAVADCAILKISDFRQDPNLTTAGGFSGPFKIISNLKSGEVSIEKWRTDPLDSKNPPKTIAYFTTDKNPVELAYTGETDTLDHDRVKPEDVKALEEKGWGTTPSELSGEVFVVLNPDTIPEDARKLMYASISAPELADAIGRPTYRAAFGLIPHGLPGELSVNDVSDIQKPILEPLKKPTKVTLDFEKTSDLEAKIADFLTAKWSKLNITVTLNPLPKGEKLQKLFGKKSQAIIGRKAMDYPDGFSVLGYFKGNYDSNYFFVNDPNIDRALAEVIQISDTNARETRYRNIQKQILKKWTLIPLLFGSEASGLWSYKLKSLPVHPLGYHMLPMESLEVRN